MSERLIIDELLYDFNVILKLIYILEILFLKIEIDFKECQSALDLLRFSLFSITFLRLFLVGSSGCSSTFRTIRKITREKSPITNRE